MTNQPNILHLLRNTPVRELEGALLRDGFVLRRQTRTGGRIYSQRDGRITVIHYHRANDTLTRRTLASLLLATRWTEEDARNLGLIR